MFVTTESLLHGSPSLDWFWLLKGIHLRAKFLRAGIVFRFISKLSSIALAQGMHLTFGNLSSAPDVKASNLKPFMEISNPTENKAFGFP